MHFARRLRSFRGRKLEEQIEPQTFAPYQRDESYLAVIYPNRSQLRGSERQQTMSDYFPLTKISSSTREMREWKFGLGNDKQSVQLNVKQLWITAIRNSCHLQALGKAAKHNFGWVQSFSTSNLI